PRPPISPPFPYTTLFRSPRAMRADTDQAQLVEQTCEDGPVAQGLLGQSMQVQDAEAWFHACTQVVDVCRLAADLQAAPLAIHARSEEHTSELQSLAYLVC